MTITVYHCERISFTSNSVTFYIVLKKQVEMAKFTVDIWVSLSALFDQRTVIVSYTLQMKI
jgi:hypothetical protein